MDAAIDGAANLLGQVHGTLLVDVWPDDDQQLRRAGGQRTRHHLRDLNDLDVITDREPVGLGGSGIAVPEDGHCVVPPTC